MNKLGLTLAIILLIGSISCAKNKDSFFDDAEVIELDPCDIQIALNLKYLKMTNRNQQLAADQSGAQLIRLFFDFDFTAPSNLTRSCFNRGVKFMYFSDKLGKIHELSKKTYRQTDKGIELDIPLNSVQSMSESVENYSNEQKVGFLNKLKLFLEIGNTRVTVRKYTIDYQIYELMNGSVEFSQPIVVFENAGMNVSLG